MLKFFAIGLAVLLAAASPAFAQRSWTTEVKSNQTNAPALATLCDRLHTIITYDGKKGAADKKAALGIAKDLVRTIELPRMLREEQTGRWCRDGKVQFAMGVSVADTVLEILDLYEITEKEFGYTRTQLRQVVLKDTKAHLAEMRARAKAEGRSLTASGDAGALFSFVAGAAVKDWAFSQTELGLTAAEMAAIQADSAPVAKRH